MSKQALRVFISHSFHEQSLAETLETLLNDEDIIGYMAERVKEYELLIIDKIKKEISESDFLIAIITNDGIASPSVNQEIGYAQGKDVSVIIMMEEGVKNTGVLVHGKELEYFKKDEFSESCLKVIQYLLQQKGRRRLSRSETRPIIISEKAQSSVNKKGVGHVHEVGEELKLYVTIRNTGSAEADDVFYHAEEVPTKDLNSWIRELPRIRSSRKSLGSLVRNESRTFSTPAINWRCPHSGIQLIALWLQYTFSENEQEETIIVLEAGRLTKTLEAMKPKRYTDRKIREAEEKPIWLFSHIL
jgi:hypothetical protein